VAGRRQARATPAMRPYAALWQGGLSDPAGWLAARGWRAERHDRAEQAARYGRPVAGPAGGALVTATRD
jgi:O-methyltransferase involved in polyketide biosynthesis